MAKSTKNATIKIRQIKSGICTPPSHRETLRGLGLRRIRHVVERQDSPAVRGMISKISYLVEVVEEKAS
jgi:large subunit ribosomal protein L30